MNDTSEAQVKLLIEVNNLTSGKNVCPYLSLFPYLHSSICILQNSQIRLHNLNHGGYYSPNYVSIQIDFNYVSIVLFTG